MEAILARYPGVRSVAVYAVPDDPVGDRVMAALELVDTSTFDPEDLDRFLAAQVDLGPKWLPAFVRTSEDLPKLASMKIDKTRLRREAWNVPGTFWRSAKAEPLVALDEEHTAALAHLLG